MTPENAKTHDEALEALIAASLRAPEKEPEITEEEISRYVNQFVTLSADDEKALSDSEPQLHQEIAEILRGNPVLPAGKSQHSKGIFYRRAAFDAYVVHVLSEDQNLGRTKIEKITHLVEYHCGIDFEREPQRDAAGPVDYVSRRKVESLAKKQGWYTVIKANDRMGMKYIPGANLAQALPIAARTLGSQKSRVDALIEIMRPLNTRRCEIIATLFAAWNDLLLRKQIPSDDQILSESRQNWHPKKLSIPISEWISGLAWMREHQLVPTGFGKAVRPITKTGEN